MLQLFLFLFAFSTTACQAFRFLSIGDWGDPSNTIGSSLNKFFDEEGKGAPLALLLGDNFYPAGVHSVNDPQFQKTYLDVFKGKNLEKLYFLATAGNVSL